MSGQVNYLEEAPELGQVYYCFYGLKNPDYISFRWIGEISEQRWLALYRVYPTEPEAQSAIEFVKDFFISNKEQLNYLTYEPMDGTKIWFGMNMDGGTFDIKSINFDHNNEKHQRISKDYWLFRTREDVINAINLITEALEKEYKKAH